MYQMQTGTSSSSERSVLRCLLSIVFFAAMLYCFLMAIDLLGESFKLLGKGVAEELIATTANPFAGLLIGIFTTALVQSSSLTTSLVVALVSAGALSVDGAVTIVMGANIGTTITCTIVSLGHIRRNDEFEQAYAGAMVHDVFNILSVMVLLPVQLTTGFLNKAAFFLSDIFYGAHQGGSFDSPVKAIVKPVVHGIQGFFQQELSFSPKLTGFASVVLALIIVFAALTFMVKLMRQLAASRLEHWVQKIFSSNVYLMALVGLVMTSVIQSSSITTSMMVPMLGAGLVTLEQVFPVTVGANIGTTVTALLATLAGNQAGLAIAFVHLIFNICGTMVFFVVPFMRGIPIRLTRFMASHFVRRKQLVGVYILSIFFIVPLIGLVISHYW